MSNNTTSLSAEALIKDLLSGVGVERFCTELIKQLEIPSAHRASGYAAKRRACAYLDRPDLGSQLVAGIKPGKEALTRTFSIQVAGVDGGYYEGTLRIIVIGETGDAETLLEQLKSDCAARLGMMKAQAASRFTQGSAQASLERQSSVAPDSASGLVYGMAAASTESKLLFARIEQYGPEDCTVLITGETGVGKEMVARALHTASRRTGEFVAINCGAITATLLEATLFGNARGAFTGATTERKGLFEIAEGGTIFLDEIGEMPLEQQTALLRVLQERVVRRIGAVTERPVNVRVIAATNQDLCTRVAEGMFREDLYFRLSVLPLHIAPLRERRDDIAALVNYQLAKISAERGVMLTITDEAMQLLQEHTWPGNVRELVNCLERGAVSHDKGVIRAEHITLQPRLKGLPRPAAADAATADEEDARVEFHPGLQSYDEAMLNFERRILQTALDHCNGRVREAARLLNLPRTTLRRRLEALGLGCNASAMLRPVTASENRQARIA